MFVSILLPRESGIGLLLILRISLPPDWLEDMLPLARTKLAIPWRVRWWMSAGSQSTDSKPMVAEVWEAEDDAWRRTGMGWVMGFSMGGSGSAT